MPPGFKKRPTGHEQRLKYVNFSREKKQTWDVRVL